MYLNVEKFLDSAEAGTLADILCAMLNIGSPKHLLVKSASSRDFTIELVFQCK